MCGEHQSLQHPATTHGNTRPCFSSTQKLSAPTLLPTGLCSARQEQCTVVLCLGVSVELREAGEQGCAVGGTVWPAVRREARVLRLWAQ